MQQPNASNGDGGQDDIKRNAPWQLANASESHLRLLVQLSMRRICEALLLCTATRRVPELRVHFDEPVDDG